MDLRAFAEGLHLHGEESPFHIVSYPLLLSLSDCAGMDYTFTPGSSSLTEVVISQNRKGRGGNEY